MTRAARLVLAAGAAAALALTGCSGDPSGASDSVADVETLRDVLVARAQEELRAVVAALGVEPVQATVGDNGSSGVADRFVGTLQVRAEFDVEPPGDAELEALVAAAGYDGSPSSQEGFYAADDGEGWRMSITSRTWGDQGSQVLVSWESPSVSLDADARVEAREAGLIEGSEPLDEAG